MTTTVSNKQNKVTVNRIEELAEIEKEFAKSVEKAKRIYEAKKAVVSFGIS